MHVVLSRSVISDSLQPHGLQPARLFSPWGFSKQKYWSGLPCPPLGDLLHPGIEPRSLSFQADSSQMEPSGKPKNTFARGSSWPRNQTRVSCFAGRFFTSWVTSDCSRNVYLIYSSNPRKAQSWKSVPNIEGQSEKQSWKPEDWLKV